MQIFKHFLPFFISITFCLQAAVTVDFELSFPPPPLTTLTPVSIAIHTDGTLFVADSDDQTIKVFTPTGTLITEFDGTNGGDAFENLQQIAVSASKEVYVPDINLDKVQIFDEDGLKLGEFDGTSGGGLAFLEPRAITFDDAGDVYVGSLVVIQKFTPAGVFVPGSLFNVPDNPEYITYHIEGGTPFIYLTTSVLGDTLQKYTLTGVLEESRSLFSEPAFELVATNNQIYVCDDEDWVDAFSPVDLDRISGFTGSSGGGVSFIKTTSIAVDPSGDLYVGDTSLNNIQKYDTNGVYQGITIPESLSAPLFLGIDSSDNFYVPNALGGNVTVFNDSGDFQYTINGQSPLNLVGPISVAFENTGRVFVSDPGFNRDLINVFEPDGDLLYNMDGISKTEPKFEEPWGQAFDQDGNLIIVDKDADTVEIYSPVGIFLKSLSGGPIVDPRDVAVGSDGKIYVTDQDRVEIFDASASYIGPFTPIGGTAFIDLMGVTLDSNDFLYIVDQDTQIVQAFDLGGTFQFEIKGDETGGGISFISPAGVAINSLGNVAITDRSLNIVQVYSLTITP